MKNPCNFCHASNTTCRTRNCSEYVEYLQNRKLVNIKYNIELLPNQVYSDSIQIWEGSTNKEICQAIWEKHKITYNINKVET